MSLALHPAVRTSLVLALCVGLVAVFLRNADLAQVWEAVRAARFGLLVAAVALTLVTYVIRTERWQYLLEPLGQTRFPVAFRATVIGFASSAVLPARAGELIRPYLLARREGISATAAFATIVVERVLDVVAVLVLLATYLVVFDPGMGARDSVLFAAIRLGGLVMAPAAVVAMVMMYALAGHPEWVRTGVRLAGHVLPARVVSVLGQAIRMFSEGFGVLRRPERLLASLAWSLVLWVGICIQTWVVARAFHIQMPFVGAWLMLALLVVGVSVPTPGGVGGFHEAFRLGATSFFAADNDAAVGAAILLHATSFGPVTLLGLWYAAREGLDLKGLRQLTNRAASAEVET